jgi:hypothetical protein
MRHGGEQDGKGEWVQSREKGAVIDRQSVSRWPWMEARETGLSLNNIEQSTLLFINI